MAEQLPEHSPLGGSGAKRWMACPGSVSLSKGIVDDESEFAALGTAAHAFAECALNQNSDAFSGIGSHYAASNKTFYPEFWAKAELPDDAILMDKDMADAVQTYLDAVRLWHPERNQGNSWVEKPFYCSDLHKHFHGMSDFVHVDDANRTLHVWDYKHGAGIIVEVEENPQGMYYACGILEQLDLWDKIDNIVIHIAQPRGWHSDGPIRQWEISTEDLSDWPDDVLLPAMERALVSRETSSGEHCRFCPARSHACPQLMGDMEELQIMTELAEKGADALTDEQVGKFMDLFIKAKIVNTAAVKTAFSRMSAGKKIPGFQLSTGRKNRTWKEGAEKAIKAKFGKAAMTDPVLKSPSQIEAMPEGGTLAAQWAYKPPGALTVTPSSDSRPAVNRDTKSLFKPVSKGKQK